MRLRIFLLVQLIIAVTGCSTPHAVVSDDGYTIAKIRITENGVANKSRPNMADICKGFLLSRNDVRNFFVHAYHVGNDSTDASYDILPCYASGTATINNDAYTWIIRSGGVGEFYNKTNKIVKICGKGCCNKVSGIC